MEEDIKILEEYVEWVKREGIECCAMEKELPALENLIKGYRELENKDKEYKKLEETNLYLQKLLDDVENLVIPKSKIKEKIAEDAFEVFTSEYGNIEVVCTDSLYELMEDK